VILFGATSGEAFLRGVVGERFAVRNSGAHAVVEGVGDHGCEYMTGGKVVILGPTGRNFAAGMSGGVAYVYDPNGALPSHLNDEMVDLEDLNPDDLEWLHRMLTKHLDATDSAPARRILADWPHHQRQFLKVMPRDYKRVLRAMTEAEQNGTDVDQAIMAAAHG
jgi:glutamate synthase (NADPH) large chain